MLWERVAACGTSAQGGFRNEERRKSLNLYPLTNRQVVKTWKQMLINTTMIQRTVSLNHPYETLLTLLSKV